MGAGNEKWTFTIVETAEVLGISKATAYMLAHKGSIPALRLGERIVVPKKALEKFLEGVKFKC